MVEPILYASLGFLLATLLWLLFIPAFWRRAVRLTTKRLLGRLPISTTEIVAAQDRLRAEHAMTMRAVERKAEQASAEAAEERVEAGRARSAVLTHMADATELRALIASLEAEGERLRSELAKAVEEKAERTEAATAADAAKDAALADLAAARADGSAARQSIHQERAEAAAREAEMAGLRAEIEAFRRKAEASEAASEGDLLASLRARLDEVADAIAKAAGETESGVPAVKPPQGPKLPVADSDRDLVRLVAPVRETAGAS